MRSRVLAVDDSATIRRAVALCLEEAGYEVVSASDGADALHKVQQGLSADLVVSDLHMPKLDGISLVRELRKLELFAHTPMLILTTESSDDLRSAGKLAGANAWMLKPFNPPELVALVKHLIQHTQAKRGGSE